MSFRASRFFAAAVLFFALIATAGCKKRATRYTFTGDDAYPDATITIAGRSVQKNVLDFAPGELSEHEIATLTYTTPCGKATVTASGSGANRSGVVIVDFPRPKNVVTLYFDPSLVDHELEAPRRRIPSPKEPFSATSNLRVAFGDCPRTVKIDGRTVEIPETTGGDYVLVAASKQSCFVSGVALYGSPSGSCQQETSERLTGKDAYAIRHSPNTMFEPLESKATTAGLCTNVSYVQYCRGSTTASAPSAPSAPAGSVASPSKSSAPTSAAPRRGPAKAATPRGGVKPSDDGF